MAGEASATSPRHNEAFLRAAQQGRFVVQYCVSCKHIPNFPRVVCPHCFGELGWFEPSGRGTVASFTIVHRPQKGRFDDQIPIVMALIRLDEGAELISTLIGPERLEVAIGAPVQFTGGGWSTLPQFLLAQRLAGAHPGGVPPSPSSRHRRS
jgi:hypothetical protein